jgi:hypothetical protein
MAMMEETVDAAAIALLEHVGRTLYGGDWKGSLSRALGVRRRAVNNWLSGRNPIPSGIWRNLYEAMGIAEGEIAKVRRAVKERCDG